MTMQLDKSMAHFCCMAASTPTPGVPPETDEDSTTYGSTIHTITSPPHPILHPILEPTPLVQGQPPPVAASNVELIGDHCTSVRLSYTPQGQHDRHDTIPSAISTFRTPEDSMQLHSAQRRKEMHVSGYYWSPPTLPADTHIVFHG